MTDVRSHTKYIALIAVFTALLAVCAQISLPLYVPVTLQTFAVCLTAAALDIKGAMASVSAYILLGAFGAPVFSGFRGGFSVIAGPTGGYIVGFLLTALCVCAAVKLFGDGFFVLVSSMAAGALLCCVFGTVWFMLITPGKGLLEVLSLCVFPFIIPDALKILLAAVIARRLRRLTEMNGH